MSVDRSVIAGLPLFAGAEAAAVDESVRVARPMRYEEGSVIFGQSDKPAHFFLLLQGRIRVSKATPRGDEVIVRYISPGQPFGIAVALGLPAYPAAATAAIESLALSWPSAFWSRMSSLCPQLAAHALETVGARLQDAHSRVVELSTQQADRRVAHALLRLVDQAGKKTEDGIVIDFPITRQDLAQMTGTTLFTVSRILSAWTGQGLIDSSRRHIVVRDPHRLVLLAVEAADA
jgi:CRP-like cAMP-binding protein